MELTLWIISDEAKETVYEKTISYNKMSAIEKLEEHYGISQVAARQSKLKAVKLTG